MLVRLEKGGTGKIMESFGSGKAAACQLNQALLLSQFIVSYVLHRTASEMLENKIDG